MYTRIFFYTKVYASMIITLFIQFYACILLVNVVATLALVRVSIPVGANKFLF